jgi:hypothetical protein
MFPLELTGVRRLDRSTPQDAALRVGEVREVLAWRCLGMNVELDGSDTAWQSVPASYARQASVGVAACSNPYRITAAAAA